MMSLVYKAPNGAARVILYLGTEYRVQVHMPSRKKYMTTRIFTRTTTNLKAAIAAADKHDKRHPKKETKT